ncbi:hypothetical protein LSS_20945 [Leptospira santarosai serovar Shermani str. LT 821]|uniref:Uncharacterized protein n=1 Tax=Leptospira santarosai serovar Shermani str. LT 821 TaxID=758847 RepID=A0A097ESD9_9LEPT|nr:hypothetical protein LSS_20945 [Leptospira santarosai serovar Shermani str. LT 821]
MIDCFLKIFTKGPKIKHSVRFALHSKLNDRNFSELFRFIHKT